MYQVKKTYGHSLGLSACFRQWRADSHCRWLHGYALSFELTFAAVTLDHRNWVMDFGGLDGVKEFLKRTFDHQLVIAEDDPHRDLLVSLGDADLASPLVLPAVGCEQFARLVFDYVDEWIRSENFGNGVQILSVECREHSGNSASYRRAY